MFLTAKDGICSHFLLNYPLGCNAQMRLLMIGGKIIMSQQSSYITSMVTKFIFGLE